MESIGVPFIPGFFMDSIGILMEFNGIPMD
jgi:hypothetical protein